MSSELRTRCRRLVAASSLAALVALSAGPASAAPYVSCPGGYIAKTGAECPVLPKHPVGGSQPGGGVGGGGGSVLRDLLDSIGLGGLAGIGGLI